MPPRRNRQSLTLWLIVVVQALCATVFLWDLIVSVFGFRSQPIPWEFRELLELAAGLGLILGVAAGGILISRTIRRNHLIVSQLRAASGAFAELLQDRFTEWNLTEAERDVAWFIIKGLSNAEVARLRDTAEGTVKAQGNAIFRKAGVSGRPQLLSLFIEDLMEGELPAATVPRDAPK